MWHTFVGKIYANNEAKVGEVHSKTISLFSWSSFMTLFRFPGFLSTFYWLDFIAIEIPNASVGSLLTFIPNDFSVENTALS